jgi:electron transport complex protein RnfG
MFRGGITMVIFSLLFTAVMAGMYLLTKEIIEYNKQRARVNILSQVLPQGSYDNNLLTSTVMLSEAEARLLGNDKAMPVYQAKYRGETRSVVVEAVAPDGYAGKIHLMIGIGKDGKVQAVRVLAHKETPGLGDYIELAKSPWILQFDGKTLNIPNAERWRVKKDGGDFDYVSGATITPRAIVKAVHNTLIFVMAHHDRLFA